MHFLRHIGVIIVLLLLAAPNGRAAQNRPLTNADVVKMVQSGLGDELVLTSIKQSPGTKFDTSPDALIKLKTAKVSDAIIAAMLSRVADSPPPVSAKPATSATTPSGAIAPPAAVGQVLIPDGTEVRLRLLERLTSATAHVDQRVRFEAADDVLVNDKAVIPMGAQAWGVVIETEKKKSFGRSGKLNFTIDYVKAVDGQNIRLRTTKARHGDENYVKAGVLTYLLLPAGFFVKGKDVEIPAGAEYTIFIDGERRITLKPVR